MDKKIPKNYLIGSYLDYQERYSSNMRDSDRILLEIIESCIPQSCPSQLCLIDVGCSTGNLLKYIKKYISDIKLTGSDVFSEIIDTCKNNPELSGVNFELMDIFNLTTSKKYDFVVFNAVTHFFDNENLEKVIKNLSGLLNQDGWLVGFGLLNPFNQTLLIHELSSAHPEGAIINIHPIEYVKSIMSDNGLANIEFRPFDISIELPYPTTHDDLKSYTVNAINGRRMNFRGSLYQPWHHFLARRK